MLAAFFHRSGFSKDVVERMPKERALKWCRRQTGRLGRGTTYGRYAFHGLHVLTGAPCLGEAR